MRYPNRQIVLRFKDVNKKSKTEYVRNLLQKVYKVNNKAPDRNQVMSFPIPIFIQRSLFNAIFSVLMYQCDW